MSETAQGLPVTHGLEAARQIADGARLGDVRGLLLAELGIGAVYATIGYALLRYLEHESRRLGTLETA
jgi:ABC-2 type transport system permease protein